MNIRDMNGETALHFASVSGNLKIVQLLLCQGADMSIRDNSGDTALSYASNLGHLDVFASGPGLWLS